MLLYKNNANSPISSDKMRNIVELVNKLENVTVISLPKNGKTYLTSLFSNAQGRSELGITHLIQDNFVFVPINLELEDLDEIINDFLSQYSDKPSLTLKIINIAKSKRNIVFIIDNFNFRSINNLRYVFNLKNTATQNIQYIFFALASEFYIDSFEKHKFTMAYNNIIELPYLTKDESFEWMGVEILEENLKLTIKENQQYYDFCGGVPALLKHFLRLRIRFNYFDAIVKSNETEEKINIFWQSFSENEQKVLTSISLTGSYPEEYEHVFKYLSNLNLINKDNKIIGEWIKLILKNYDKDERLILRSEEILFHNVKINELLTPIEEKLVRELIEKKTLSRDEIAHALWGDFASSEYSEYAIDQALSRLRKKLEKIGIGGDRIKTVKKVGISLIQ